MCWTRSVVSKTQATTPRRVRSSAEKNIALRSSKIRYACFKNASESMACSLSAQVSSAIPRVEKAPNSLAR